MNYKQNLINKVNELRHFCRGAKEERIYFPSFEGLRKSIVTNIHGNVILFLHKVQNKKLDQITSDPFVVYTAVPFLDKAQRGEVSEDDINIFIEEIIKAINVSTD